MLMGADRKAKLQIGERQLQPPGCNHDRQVPALSWGTTSGHALQARVRHELYALCQAAPDCQFLQYAASIGVGQGVQGTGTPGRHRERNSDRAQFFVWW